MEITSDVIIISGVVVSRLSSLEVLLSRFLVDVSLAASSCGDEVDALISDVDSQDDSDVWPTSSILSLLVELDVALEGGIDDVVDVSVCFTVGAGFVVVGGGLVSSGGQGRDFVVLAFDVARVVDIVVKIDANDVSSVEVEKVSIVESAVE